MGGVDAPPPQAQPLSEQMPLDGLTPAHDADAVADAAVARATAWLEVAQRVRTRREKANRRRLSRLLRDPAGLPVTMGLTDEVMRDRRPSRAAATLATTAERSNAAGPGTARPRRTD